MSTVPPQPNTPTPRPTARPARDYQFPRVERAQLANGLRGGVAPVTKLPLVTVFAVLEAGASLERDGQEGVAALTARLLLEGAAGQDGAALAERFERIGASVDTHANWDVATVSLTTMSARLPDAMSLVRDLLRAPDFPEREVQRLKEERLAELLQQRAEPRGLADEQFSRAVYRSSARYAMPDGGDPTTVRSLTGHDVRSFYRQHFQPAGCTLVFAGDVSMSTAERLSEALFGDWTGGEPMSAPRSVDDAQPGPLMRVVAKPDAPQSELRVGHRGPPRSAPDYFDAVVMNAVLGGLFSSRINLNLREAHGYTYGAFSGFEWRRHAGPFVISTAVKSDVTAPAIREILSEVERIRREPIDQDELTLATSYLDGVFPIRYETTTAIATALANLVIHDLPDDYHDQYRANVRAVTSEGVLRAAREYLHPDALRVVVVGDPSPIAAALAELEHAPVEIITADGPEFAS